MTFVVVIVVLAIVLTGLIYLVRSKAGTRGRLAVDAATGSTGSQYALQRQLSHDVLSRVAPSTYQPGGVAMKGKAKKATDQLARTFVVRAEPAAVAQVLAPVVAADGRFRPAEGGLAAGEVAAWEAPGMFGPYPRLAIRQSTLLPGVTEFGVTHFQWSMKFPQGGPIVAKLWDPALAALRSAGLVVSEHVRDFQPDDDVRTELSDRDGRWHAEGLLPIGPDMSKAG